MDINKYYDNLDLNKKPSLIISQRGKAFRYSLLSNSIYINKNKITIFKSYEIKFLICHELGYFLRLKSIYFLKFINFLIFLACIPILGYGLKILSYHNFLDVVGFGFLIGVILRQAFNAVDDYQDFLADFFVVQFNKLNIEQYKAISQGINEKIIMHKFNQAERKIKRISRWLQEVDLKS